MSEHAFSIERVVITGVGYGGMDTRLEETLVCSCGSFRKRLSGSISADKHEKQLHMITHAVQVLTEAAGISIDLHSIRSIDKGCR